MAKQPAPSVALLPGAACRPTRAIFFLGTTLPDCSDKAFLGPQQRGGPLGTLTSGTARLGRGPHYQKKKGSVLSLPGSVWVCDVRVVEKKSTVSKSQITLDAFI